MAGRIIPKKHLGQHFLADKGIAEKIANCLIYNGDYLLEVGPGTGSLTQFLTATWGEKLWLVEIDGEAAAHLRLAFPDITARIIEGDFLTLNLQKLFNNNPINIVGNFPYNISSQILFKAIENRTEVTQLVGMFQEEVAKRICSPPGNKDYGILSVLTQAFFETNYLFSVPPSVFVPPPAVNSGVIRLVAKQGFNLRCNSDFYRTVVKAAFNQRRKKLSNALAGFAPKGIMDKAFCDLRAEQLSWKDFEELACTLENPQVT